MNQCGCGEEATFVGYFCEEHAKCVELFDRRRETIATQILAGLVSKGVSGNTEEWLIKKSVSLADALIKELEEDV